MKTLCLISVPFLVLAGSFGSAAGTDAPLAAATYTITENGPHHRTWETVRSITGPSGEILLTTNSFLEIATGLNYWDPSSEQWKESKEEIIGYPDGAVATNGQHKVIFSADLQTAIAIDLLTPDGQRLQSHILGLSYQDTSGSNVLIAEVKSSKGVILPPNQVLYEDAFTDFKADVLYTYTKAGFEQDIILRERPPLPELFGLDSGSCVLQVLTEFETSPAPTISSASAASKTGQVVSDQRLDFGAMKIGAGKAFLMGGDPLDGIPVSKEWAVVEGRKILVEQVSVPAVAKQLDDLPVKKSSSRSRSSQSIRTASVNRTLPKFQPVKTDKREMKVSQLPISSRGLVIDYTISSGQTNFTFQGDTTYYVIGLVNLYSNITFEAGAVIKYNTNSSLTFPNMNAVTLDWQGRPYRPVVFTSRDDDSVGEVIQGSSGNPTTNFYGSPALSFNGSVSSISNLRIAFAQSAITIGGTALSITNVQIFGCSNGIALAGATVRIRNALFASNTNDLIINGSSIFDIQNTTFSGSTRIAKAETWSTGSSVTFTNCIMESVANVSVGVVTIGGDFNGFYQCSPFGTVQITNTFYPFQTAGAGNYYLTNDCSFLNSGTTAANSGLLAELVKKTTYPPIVLSPVTNSFNVVLTPQAQRDYDAPDLGYHYEPIDFITDTYAFTNATLSISNGTAIAYYNRPGILIQDGSSVTSVGSALAPNWFVRYQAVQEQALLLGGSPNSSGVPFSTYHVGATGPTGVFQFTRFAALAGSLDQITHFGSSSYSYLSVRDCEVWNGQTRLAGGTNTIAVINNSLFVRSLIPAAANTGSTNNSLSFSNNLCRNLTINPRPGTTMGNVWYLFNNSFDTCALNPASSLITNGYNAYIKCNQQLNPTSTNNVVLTNAFVYQSGPLGDFYQPSTSSLLGTGSVAADLAGLYHYTVTTNLVSGLQIKETNSVVDIGYHYVAVTFDGLPIDTDTDGVPDHLEDSNGNDVVNSGETDWQISTDLGLKVLITRPKNNSIIP